MRASKQAGAPVESSMSFKELEDYAAASGLRLKIVENGPMLRIEAYPLNVADEAIGYLTAFIRPFPFKLFHLDTIRVKNRRQNIGFQRTGYTIEGPGISFIMGSYALTWAQSKGCRTTQLLAVKDSEDMHNILVRLYESFGFKTIRFVGDEQSSVADRLVWGAVGTLMEMDIASFMREWSPKLRSMTKMAKLMATRQQSQGAELSALSSSSDGGSLGGNTSSSSSSNSSDGNKQKRATIALTREDGANSKLAALLADQSCIEIPCIAFEPGKDSARLPAVLADFDVTVITSPQAASVYLTAWTASGRPGGIKIVTVGKGTSKPLAAAGLAPVFEPSDATAEALARELPLALGPRVLYPSSSIAEKTLTEGLESRGFSVTKLDTYETVSAAWTDTQLQQARAVDVVTFASPSTVKVWAERVGTAQKAVVIGPTSAQACKKAGWKDDDVFCPEGSRGMDAWAELVKRVAG